MKIILHPFKEIRRLEFTIQTQRGDIFDKSLTIKALDKQLLRERNQKAKLEEDIKALNLETASLNRDNHRLRKNIRGERKANHEHRDRIYAAISQAAEKIQTHPNDSITDIFNEAFQKQELPLEMDHKFRI